MKKKNICVSIIFLLIVFVVQFSYLSQNTTARAVLDYKNMSFENDSNYFVLKELTELLLENIPEKDSKNITLIFNNKTSPYQEFGIGYLYIRYLVFPMTMYTSYEYYTDISKKKYLDEQIVNEDLDYILLLGKDTKLFNELSTNDYTLYEVVNKENNQIREVASVNFGLYDIYNSIETEEEKEEFEDLVADTKKMLEEDWSFSAIGLMKNFANDLFLHNEYDLAMEYSYYYIDKVDYINEILNMNLGDIYRELNNYEQAIHHYEICLRNQACDSVNARKNIDELVSLMQKEVK